jgi:hypothetical protein
MSPCFLVAADFDNKETQGILYWLGTSGGTEEWKNPAESDLVKITRSSYGHGKASDVADRKGSWCSTSNKASQWWKIDFGEKRSILPSAYTLQVRVKNADTLSQQTTRKTLIFVQNFYHLSYSTGGVACQEL